MNKYFRCKAKRFRDGKELSNIMEAESSYDAYMTMIFHGQEPIEIIEVDEDGKEI